MINDENPMYVVGLGDEKRIEDHILVKLTAHCDKVMDAYVKRESKKNDATRRAGAKHHRMVEKYLANQEKLIKKLIRTK